jgi:prevent-host-death family protein
MKAVPVYDAKNRFSELLALVEAGEEVAITRRGVLVARLVAATPPDFTAQKAAVADLFEQLRQLRSKIELTGDLKALARAGLD